MKGFAAAIVGQMESQQSASADWSSGLFKINTLPSGRADYFELLRVPAERIEHFLGMGGVEPCAKPM